MSSFNSKTLLNHAIQFPHDVEGYVVPCMRKMVTSGYKEDARVLCEAIVAQNPSLSHLMVEFMSEISRTCMRYSYMDKEGKPRETIKKVAMIYNRYDNY